MTEYTETANAAQGASRRADTRGHNLPRLIIATFLQLMRTHDPHSISFRDIAAAAGISHMAPYRHFGSKQALLDRIADLGFAMLAQSLEEAAGRHARAPRRQMDAACACYYRFAVDNPAYAQVMFGTERGLWNKAGPLPAFDRTRAILRRIIRRCRLAGDLPGGVDDDRVLALLWPLVHGYTLLAATRVLTERDAGVPDAFLADGVNVILAGLAGSAR
jgi:AcrR family transcriptional regulator